MGPENPKGGSRAGSNSANHDARTETQPRAQTRAEAAAAEDARWHTETHGFLPQICKLSRAKLELPESMDVILASVNMGI